jgi:hypothetical protein
MDILLFLIPVAFYIGWKVNEAWMLLSFRTILQELKISNDQLVKIARDKGIQLTETDPDPEPESDPGVPALLEVRLEQIDGQIFAYSLKDDQFLGQGTDRDTLVQRLTENLTNVRVIIAKEHGADLIYDTK